MKYLGKKEVSIVDCIEDHKIYPRHSTDKVRTSEYTTAMRSGIEFPPIKVEKSSMKIVDGWHRTDAHLIVKHEKFIVEFYSFDDAADLIWWSIHWNAQHGLKLTQHDQAKCINMARGVGLGEDKIAAALCITVDKITKMEVQRIRIETVSGQPAEVKRVISDITKTTVTPEQLLAQKPFNAMGAGYNIARSTDALKYNLVPINAYYIKAIEELESECSKWLENNKDKLASGQ
jgi:hypothetical protein